jgi:hypothetical protein
MGDTKVIGSGCAAVRLCGCAAVRLCGCAAVRLCGCAAVRLCGFSSMGLGAARVDPDNSPMKPTVIQRYAKRHF